MGGVQAPMSVHLRRRPSEALHLWQSTFEQRVTIYFQACTHGGEALMHGHTLAVPAHCN